MSHHAIQGAVDAVGQMAAYQPKHLLDIVGMAHAAPQVIAATAASFAAVAASLENTPAAAQADAYRQIAGQLTALASQASESGAVMEAAHAGDLDRIRNPRPGEHLADYRTNQG